MAPLLHVPIPLIRGRRGGRVTKKGATIQTDGQISKFSAENVLIIGNVLNRNVLGFGERERKGLQRGAIGGVLVDFPGAAFGLLRRGVTGKPT